MIFTGIAARGESDMFAANSRRCPSAHCRAGHGMFPGSFGGGGHVLGGLPL